MSTQKAKFRLFSHLQEMGFTYDESAALRRIEMTLHRWAEAECNGEIQRAEPRKLAVWNDPASPDGLRVVALTNYGHFDGTIKLLPEHLKATNDPDYIPPQALEILAKLQERENEVLGKPYRVTHYRGQPRQQYPIADREAGALKRLAAIVAARNERYNRAEFREPNQEVFFYHQGDPRGCALYLVTREQLVNKLDTTQSVVLPLLPLDQYYNRGLAVCA